MECPICKQQLVMSDRQGIEIDYCPQCRGVLLDRGELDKIIEKSASFQAPQHAQNAHNTFQPQPQATNHNPQPQQRTEDHSQHRNDHYASTDSHYGQNNHNTHNKHKKESWLGEIFDF